MSRKPIDRLQEGLDRDLVGGGQDRGRPAAGAQAHPARGASAGNRTGSGSAKSSRPICARFSRGERWSADGRGQASAWAIGMRMSGAAELGQHAAVAVADHAVHHRLLVDQHVHLGFRQVEQPRRLDQLQPLVEHGGGIDADLRCPSTRPGGARRPPAVAACISANAGGAERAAGRGQHDALDGAADCPRPCAWKMALCSESTGSRVAPAAAHRLGA